MQQIKAQAIVKKASNLQQAVELRTVGSLGSKVEDFHRQERVNNLVAQELYSALLRPYLRLKRHQGTKALIKTGRERHLQRVVLDRAFPTEGEPLNAGGQGPGEPRVSKP